jgi:hypothetical protein
MSVVVRIEFYTGSERSLPAIIADLARRIKDEAPDDLNGFPVYDPSFSDGRFKIGDIDIRCECEDCGCVDWR